jgi:hypothetical protein
MKLYHKSDMLQRSPNKSCNLRWRWDVWCSTSWRWHSSRSVKQYGSSTLVTQLPGHLLTSVANLKPCDNPSILMGRSEERHISMNSFMAHSVLPTAWAHLSRHNSNTMIWRKAQSNTSSDVRVSSRMVSYGITGDIILVWPHTLAFWGHNTCWRISRTWSSMYLLICANMT